MRQVQERGSERVNIRRKFLRQRHLDEPRRGRPLIIGNAGNAVPQTAANTNQRHVGWKRRPIGCEQQHPPRARCINPRQSLEGASRARKRAGDDCAESRRTTEEIGAGAERPQPLIEVRAGERNGGGKLGRRGAREGIGSERGDTFQTGKGCVTPARSRLRREDLPHEETKGVAWRRGQETIEPFQLADQAPQPRHVTRRQHAAGQVLTLRTSRSRCRDTPTR